MEGERSRSRAATTNTLSPSSFPRFEIHHQVHLSTTKYAQYTLHSVFSPRQGNSGKNKKLPIASSKTCKEAQGLSPRRKNYFLFSLCPPLLRVLVLPAVFQQSEPFRVFFLRTRSQPKKKDIGTLAWGDFLFKSMSLLFKIFCNSFLNVYRKGVKVQTV